MNLHPRAPRSAAILLLGLFLLSCASISPYSSTAYEQATSLKVEALALMTKATEPFDEHRQEVESLITKVNKAYEYAKGRPKNQFSTRQWEILKDPDRNLLGGFLKRWENESTLSKAYTDGGKKLVADAFDTIIALESGKAKPTQTQ